MARMQTLPWGRRQVLALAAYLPFVLAGAAALLSLLLTWPFPGWVQNIGVVLAAVGGYLPGRRLVVRAYSGLDAPAASPPSGASDRT